MVTRWGLGTGCDWCGHLGTPTDNLYSTSVNNFEKSIKYPCWYFLFFGAHPIQLVIHFHKISKEGWLSKDPIGKDRIAWLVKKELCVFNCICICISWTRPGKANLSWIWQSAGLRWRLTEWRDRELGKWPKSILPHIIADPKLHTVEHRCTHFNSQRDTVGHS